MCIGQGMIHPALPNNTDSSESTLTETKIISGTETLRDEEPLEQFIDAYPGIRDHVRFPLKAAYLRSHNVSRNAEMITCLKSSHLEFLSLGIDNSIEGGRQSGSQAFTSFLSFRCLRITANIGLVDRCMKQVVDNSVVDINLIPTLKDCIQQEVGNTCENCGFGDLFQPTNNSNDDGVTAVRTFLKATNVSDEDFDDLYSEIQILILNSITNIDNEDFDWENTDLSLDNVLVRQAVLKALSEGNDVDDEEEMNNNEDTDIEEGSEEVMERFAEEVEEISDAEPDNYLSVSDFLLLLQKLRERAAEEGNGEYKSVIDSLERAAEPSCNLEDNTIDLVRAISIATSNNGEEFAGNLEEILALVESDVGDDEVPGDEDPLIDGEETPSIESCLVLPTDMGLDESVLNSTENIAEYINKALAGDFDDTKYSIDDIQEALANEGIEWNNLMQRFSVAGINYTTPTTTTTTSPAPPRRTFLRRRFGRFGKRIQRDEINKSMQP
ncbi:unnamed protein product [Cyprideis torosa]|uniref:Uncharacterized protein n=1 Tax=Cyprideis torosa TaxID=163714 RepID=A0A7R8W5Y2_9CRUS|nr:unnamed protein product [Cyprideis torosa]CAG0885879.1 unnamed protein product [Cyprideis torosa]